MGALCSAQQVFQHAAPLLCRLLPSRCSSSVPSPWLLPTPFAHRWPDSASSYARGAAGHLPGFGAVPGRQGLQSGLQRLALHLMGRAAFSLKSKLYFMHQEKFHHFRCVHRWRTGKKQNTSQVINLRAKQELMEGTSFTRVSQFVTPSPTAAARLCFFALS